MRVVSGPVLSFACALACVACQKTVNDACADLAAAECARRAACGIPPPPGDDRDACERDVAARCARLPALPGATLAGEDIEACAAAYEGYPCASLVLHAVPPACRFSGNGTNGAACIAGAQCRSAYCRPAAEGHCGECSALRTENDACSLGGSPCAAGLHCGEAGHCVPFGSTGDACGALAPCDPLHFCNAQGVCAPQAGEGEPCAGAGQCSLLDGLVCDGVPGTCEPAGAKVFPEPALLSCD